MKSLLIFVLFTAISANVFNSRSLFNTARDGLDTRQSSVSCTEDDDTFIGIGQTCSRTSGNDCKGLLACATTNGGSAYTCQYLTPSSSCSASSDCSGLPCSSGKCQFPIALPGQSCASNSNCMSGDCSSGTCLALASGATCSSSLTCGKGLFCSKNSTSLSDGVCTARVANGGDCSAYLSSVDSDLTCANGACSYSVSSTGVISGVCTAFASLSAGTTFLGSTTLCQSNLYAVYNPSTFQYTCESSAPSCNNQRPCSSVSNTECDCPSSGTGNGTCDSLSCGSQSESALKCLISSDFGVTTAIAALYDNNAQCSSQTRSLYCCGADDDTTYLPSGFCSSSVMIAPILAIVVAFVALAF